MAASQLAKELGCEDLAQVARYIAKDESGSSVETARRNLQNWYHTKPKQFRAICLGVAEDSGRLACRR